MKFLVTLGLIAVAASRADLGSQACAPCHQEIWRTYRSTAMANSSGIYTKPDNSAIRRFSSPGGTVEYSVDPGTSFRARTGGVEVSRQLEYFIGSGAAGRSFLTRVDGFLFQAPVSFYSSDATWRVSPGFERSEALNLARPVEPSCLNCHSSGVRPISGTLNAYQAEPFREGGVGCERCHGAGERHIARPSKDTIVNPARLVAAARDSVCAQCHLSGNVRVQKLNVAKPFAPGDLLSASSAVFLWSPPKARQANGHVEELSRSRCKLASGDKLWCGTCHNTHLEPPQSMKAAFYRERCSACHALDACAAPKSVRQAKADDCTACHMPRSQVRDVQHAAYTDHTIPKPGRNSVPTPVAAGKPVLVSFGDGISERDYALAIALIALRDSDRALGQQAFSLLRTAYAAHPEDNAAASQLAQLYDRMGQEQSACKIYGEIAGNATTPPAALNNLGACVAKEGHLAAAMSLWETVTERDPAEESAWTNLAVAQIQTGDAARGQLTLLRALRFHPTSGKVRELLADLAR